MSSISKSLQAHYDAVRALGCLACKAFDGRWVYPELHHPHGKATPAKLRKVIPLCVDHHTGDANRIIPSVHGSKKIFRRHFGSEKELLEAVERAIA